MRRFRPEVVFHAAAHKHVPLMEDNVCEAVQNNIVGTYNVVEACVKYEVGRMVQISTDKAADPSSVMGATKCVCEMIVRSAAQEFPRTSFVCVRFGNVLGSRGSVIRVFDKQIKDGGPVTVTHPEMTRYFMAIPEAVRLVIQTGGVGENGGIYLLDMGTPVKVLDLAEDMIRLNGYEPGVDIEVVFTGMRPGEKLQERLSSMSESVERCQHEGLKVIKAARPLPYAQTTSYVAEFAELARNLDGEGVFALFGKVIPSYTTGFRPEGDYRSRSAPSTADVCSRPETL